jgi:two-component system, chemotaxis family, response regulator Rcp1
MMTANARILLVEDNEGDIILTLKAMEKAGVKNAVDVVRDGEKAIDFLKKQGAYHNAETPGLILLDINLPKLNGKEVLAMIKTYDELRMIPVIMLTTSGAETDIRQSYYNHANCFITKPADFSDFMMVVQSLKQFWINIVSLPNINLNEEKN